MFVLLYIALVCLFLAAELIESFQQNAHLIDAPTN